MADASPPKRAREGSDGESPADTKRPRACDKPAEAAAQHVPKRLQLVPLPDAIQALPHVLTLIETLAMTPEEALAEAIRTTNVEWAKEILGRFDCALDDAMTQAATVGHRDIVERLLAKKVGFKPDEDEERGASAIVVQQNTRAFVNETAMTAAANGHVGIVEILLPLVLGLSTRDGYSSSWFPVVRKILDAGAANGHLSVVERMVHHAIVGGYANRYSIWPAVDTLSKAIRGGHSDVANFLLDNEAPFWNLQQAFVSALERGFTDLADRIFDVYPQRYRGDNLFLALAERGRLDAVKYLYNKGCSDPGIVGKAFAKAPRDGQTEVIEFLLETGRISSEAFDKAFKGACSGWSKDIGAVTFLYGLKRASSEGINRAFGAASKAAVMEFLFKNEKITEKAIVTAFSKRVLLHDGNDADIIQLLLKQACIPSELIDKAFVQAAREEKHECFVGLREKKKEIVESLRGDSRLSGKALGEALVNAVKSLSPDLMRSLYDEKRTPPEALVRGFTEAAHRRNLAMVKDIVKFVSAERVPSDYQHQVFIAAARHGDMPILDIVRGSANGEWPLLVLKEALAVAGGNAKIESCIRKMICEQVFKEHP